MRTRIHPDPGRDAQAVPSMRRRMVSESRRIRQQGRKTYQRVVVSVREPRRRLKGHCDDNSTMRSGAKSIVERLRDEQAAPTMSGMRNIYSSMHPSVGLTPERLDADSARGGIRRSISVSRTRRRDGRKGSPLPRGAEHAQGGRQRSSTSRCTPASSDKDDVRAAEMVRAMLAERRARYRERDDRYPRRDRKRLLRDGDRVGQLESRMVSAPPAMARSALVHVRLGLRRGAAGAQHEGRGARDRDGRRAGGARIAFQGKRTLWRAARRHRSR